MRFYYAYDPFDMRPSKKHFLLWESLKFAPAEKILRMLPYREDDEGESEHIYYHFLDNIHLYRDDVFVAELVDQIVAKEDGFRAIEMLRSIPMTEVSTKTLLDWVILQCDEANYSMVRVEQLKSIQETYPEVVTPSRIQTLWKKETMWNRYAEAENAALADIGLGGHW